MLWPFGAECHVMLAGNARDGQKFDGKLERGILLGYHMHPGNIWSKDYLVMRLDDFDIHDPWKIPHVHRIRKIMVESFNNARL